MFFLELNARIQVEHPVTEAVTGLDLVELQLRVADGERLTGLEPGTHGHAVEARLYAEDPRTFLPKDGRITRLALPESIRVDAGVAEGDEVGTRYDPMIAKLVAHAADRDAALDLLADALDETVVEGVTTNLPFLRWLVAHPAFRRGGAVDRVPRAVSAAFRTAPSGAAGLGRELAAQPSLRRGAPAARGRGGRAHRRNGERPTGASPRRCPAP